MRQTSCILVALIALWAGTAFAEPSLVVMPTASGHLRLRLVAPDGSVVWKLDTDVGRDMSARYRPDPGWFRGDGTYVAVGVLENETFPREYEQELVIHADSRIEWPLSEPPHAFVSASPDITVTMADTETLTLLIRNATKESLYGGFLADASTLNITRLDSPAAVKESWLPSDLVIGPGESREVPLRAASSLEPGRYQVTIRLQRTDPRKGHGRKDTSEVIELTTPPFDFAPGTVAKACLDEPKPPALPAPPEGQLVQTAAAVFWLKRSGDLIRVDDGSMKAIAHFDGATSAEIWPDGKHLLIHGSKWLVSSDGGLTFTSVEAHPRAYRETWRPIGDRWLRSDPEGGLDWIDASGRVTSAHAPVKGAWQWVAVHDAKHLAILGDCSVLLETEDGGAHWAVHPTPRPFLTFADWAGDDLEVFSGHGRLIRRAGQTKFEEQPVAPLNLAAQKKRLPSHLICPGYSCFAMSRSMHDGVVSWMLHLTIRNASGGFDEHEFAPEAELAPSFDGVAWLPDSSIIVSTSLDGLFRIKGDKVATLAISPELEEWRQAKPARDAQAKWMAERQKEREARLKQRREHRDASQPGTAAGRP